MRQYAENALATLEPIDARVLAEYYLWLAFTAATHVDDEPRFKVAVRYFQLAGVL